MPAVALLVAAGSGERLGADRPKAFAVLAGRPMLEWSIAALKAVPEIGAIVVAIPPEIGAMLIEPGFEIAYGGATRSQSVRNALAAAPPDADRVIVHDAARPLADPALFTRCLAALDETGVAAAIAAAPVTDTVKEAGGDGVVERTLDRSRLWAVQTPQAFRREALESALDVDDETLAAATDDAWLVERRGGKVVVVESAPRNLKVTTPHDLRVAELLLTT
jgi:2-C-methyl-D-erythritol 4-phosphate cytidylyltransferase